MENQKPQVSKSRPPLKDPGYTFPLRYYTKYVLKTHYPLAVMHVFTAGTCVASAAWLIRALIWSPDVNFFHKKGGRFAWEGLDSNYRFQLYVPDDKYMKEGYFDRGQKKQ